jgi:hypothetical protein
MWSTESIWFDLTVMFGIFGVGSILFGHFEHHKPKFQRILKVALVACATATLSMAGLRWLPSHGINGWTGEPKEKYYGLLKVPEHRRPRS